MERKHHMIFPAGPLPRLTSAQRGLGLIEVLLAVVILSIGLLGLASLQGNSLKFNHSAYLRTQATQLAYDMADRMRANRTATMAGSYAIALSDDPLTSPGNQVDRDKTEWLNSLASVLPNGDGSVVLDTSNGYSAHATITIRWTDDRTGEDVATEQFVFETEI